MSTTELTVTTVRYLFASTWAAGDESGSGMFVPGAKVHARNTSGNLLNLAVGSLREQGLIEVDQLRPVEKEGLVVAGGRSFARVRPLPGEAARLEGLEGVLLTKMRMRNPDKGLGARLARKLSKDDEWGLRASLLELDYDRWSPWSSVAALCFAEAKNAQLVDVEGGGRRGRIVITDPAGLSALEPRNAEIAEARRRYLEREPELNEATISDCFAALDRAHKPGNN